ncbi:hypothetical protein BWI97_08725 [Siphonobacter sp. BAB-5405]|uniref:hypothetical protein n=1 Tax=Siphonobacter sp. BAB-5405 TaxID=1864825 RepID=UPI000C7FF008|nr:hypothetical protein [Siphonobacter sp. BAB-5405]PMD97683.1 hypothetical protein BWI97_08725 [Siphonobacter sp. BAB-5405]
MNHTEWRIQKIKAKANLDLIITRFKRNLATQEELDQAQQIFDALKEFKAEPDPVTPTPVPSAPVTPETPPAAVVPLIASVPENVPVMKVSEFTQLMENLSIERAEAHKQMCLRSNQMANFPPTQNIKKQVDEIQAYKRQRNEIGEKIAYLEKNGKLPDPEPQDQGETPAPQTSEAFLKNLPADRYEINKILKDSLLPNLSKARKKLATATQENWKAHYAQKVALLEAQVAGARSKMSSLN